MSLRINQNVLSLRTYGTLSSTANSLEKTIGRLSSGTRINNAADDAAGLAISEKMRRQIRGLSRARLNAQDGISMVQTAEGALNESQSILQRMRELATQSANDTLTSNDRLEIQKEVSQLKQELDRIATSTEFNTKKLLDGSQTALVSSNSRSVTGLVSGTPMSGGDFDVSIALIQGGVSQMQRSQIFTLNDGSGKLAEGGTQLKSIAQFYDANGVFALDTPQIMTLRGNGDEHQVMLDGLMTLDQLAANLQNALSSRSGLDIKSSRVGMVSTVQTQVAGAGGYLQLTSGFIGDRGEFSFSTDEKVAQALGFSVIREASNNQVELYSKDSSGNTRTSRIDGSNASGLLDGIDLQFVSQAAQVAGIGGLELGLDFSANQTFTVSVNGTALAINVAADANLGHTMQGIARSINIQIAAGGAGLKGLAASVVDGEIRLSYEKPISVSATVANTIVIAGASADSIGLSNGTYNGFVDGSKNLDDAKWGFSRMVSTVQHNLADATDIVVSVSDGIGSVAVTLFQTIASGTNAADMVLFSTFQATVNLTLKNATVAIRVDQVGSAMAFTSLKVGTVHANTASYTSLVSLENFTANSDSLLRERFGLSEGTAKGSGDANFKLHVVDRQSQFQLGADEGQTMGLNIANMSAKALGVDNLDLSSVSGANRAMGEIAKALDRVSSERAKLGAYQSRLEHTVSNLDNMYTNMISAESRIRDADIAMEMIDFTRLQIMSQAGTAMLSQANVAPQRVLDLIGTRS